MDCRLDSVGGCINYYYFNGDEGLLVAGGWWYGGAELCRGIADIEK